MVDLRATTIDATEVSAELSRQPVADRPLIVLTDAANGNPCTAVSPSLDRHGNLVPTREALPGYCATIDAEGTVVTVADDVRIPALLTRWYGDDGTLTGGKYVWAASMTTSANYTMIPAILLALLLAALVGLAVRLFASGQRPREQAVATGVPGSEFRITPMPQREAPPWPRAPQSAPALTPASSSHQHAIARTFIGKQGGYVATGGLLRWAEQPPDDVRVAEPGDAVLVVGDGRGRDELRVKIVPRDRAERTFV